MLLLWSSFTPEPTVSGGHFAGFVGFEIPLMQFEEGPKDDDEEVLIAWHVNMDEMM